MRIHGKIFSRSSDLYSDEIAGPWGNRACTTKYQRHVLRDPSKFSGTLRNGTHLQPITAILDLAPHAPAGSNPPGWVLVNRCSSAVMSDLSLDDFLRNSCGFYNAFAPPSRFRTGEDRQFVHGDGKMHVDHSSMALARIGFSAEVALRLYPGNGNDVDFIRVDGYPPRYKPRCRRTRRSHAPCDFGLSTSHI